MFHILLLGVGAGYFYYYYYNKFEEDKTSRASETVVPPQEKKDLLGVQPTYQRPLVLPGRGYVGSAFNPTSLGYNPLSDLPPESTEQEIKVLNIANRFLYG
jgi:hypothetical protein